MLDLIIKNGKCFIQEDFNNVEIGIKNGKIVKVGNIDAEAKEIIDAKNLLVLPGCIDTQVHFREPGSTDAEDLNTGSRAAILGGITSVFEMPNTNPPTSNKKEFEKKLNLARGRMYTNHAFYFGATPDNYKELSDLKNLVGCCGIKLFAGSSTGNLLVDKEKDIENVFKHASKIVSVHSEDEEILNLRKRLREIGNVQSHNIWRNPECSISSTRKIVRIAKKYNKKVHILHITTKEEVDFLYQNKGNLTFEITPQHLTLSAPDCYNELGTYAQMNPPIRENSHQERLWYAVKNNINDLIGSDHAPHLKEKKDKQYPDTPSGMPGVQTLLPIMLNHVNEEKLTIKQLIRLICENPVKIFGIQNKGYIKENFDADLTLIDMNKVTIIDNKHIASKCGWTPFHGKKVKGFPIYTIINGSIKMKDGLILGEPTGRPILFS